MIRIANHFYQDCVKFTTGILFSIPFVQGWLKERKNSAATITRPFWMHETGLGIRYAFQ
jgi:lipid-A-disaccharide synthase-like uncharacterized protein